jgi:iron complex transport system substrate-binding protein
MTARGGAENAEPYRMNSLDEVTGEIVDAAYKLHSGLGPGLLESVYEAVLARDLQRRGLIVQRQQVVAFEYDGMHLMRAFASTCWWRTLL